MKRMLLILTAVIATALCAPAADALTESLQKGLFEEEANHNLDAAIKAYQDVLARADEQRRVAATALFRLAECYRKQGKTNEATAEYRRLLRDYADQSTLATLSRQNLAGLVTSAPAAATASEPAVASTDVEEKEIRRIKAMIKDSPDLINARSQGPGGTTVLHNAAGQGHLLVAEFLLANGADVNARDLYNSMPNNTPLHVAAANGHKRVVELLLAKGADVNAGDWTGRTPLHGATSRGFRAVIEVLLANKANVNARDDSGWTPLHTAVFAGHRQIAELLVDRGADLNASVTGDNRQGGGTPFPNEGTPLNISVQLIKPSFTQFLLEKGADPNARTGRGLMPLHYAAYSSKRASELVEIASLLIDHRAEVNARAHAEGPQNYIDWTPLMVAVNQDATNLLKLLLERGANPNITGRVSHDSEASPLQLAIQKRAHGITKLLLDRGADVNMRTNGLPSPIFQAVYNSDLQILELLLDHKADPNLRDKDGSTPLHSAVQKNKRAVELLLAKGGDPNAPGKDGDRPLHWSVRSSVTEDVAELLLVHKADPNATNGHGATPLHLIAARPNTNTLALLVKHGANVNACDHYAATPLHNILSQGTLALDDRRKAVEFLLAHGANVVKSCNGKATPFESARNYPDEIIELLRKHHPKRLARINLSGPVGARSWFWEADQKLTLSQIFQSVALNEKADPHHIKILRDDPQTGLKREHEHSLVWIREKSAPDVVVQDGDKIVVAER